MVKFNEKGEDNYLVVSKGLSEVTGEKVTILTERVVFSNKIDFEKINKEKNEVEEKIKGLLQEDEEYEKTIEDLNWAIACIEVAKEGGK
jgi:F0F1-type ATP synthase epsilon subunit